MVAALRTPDDRFEELAGWPYAPSYCQRSDGLRIHYVDAGPRGAGRTWLCLHGQPTWSYLYRRMIPVFAGVGDRVVAPDFPGFGRSDKPVEEATYSFEFHRNALLDLIAALDLGNIVLVVQDWGGLIGLTLPMAAPGRFVALLVMNAMLGTGDQPLGKGFLAWRDFSNRNLDMDIARLMQRACPQLTPEEAASYAAPFPDASYKAGVRRFPNLVPDGRDAPGAALSREARAFWRDRWAGRSLMAIGMKDPVLGRRGCARCTPTSVTVPRRWRSQRAATSCRNGASRSRGRRSRSCKRGAERGGDATSPRPQQSTPSGRVRCRWHRHFCHVRPRFRDSPLEKIARPSGLLKP